MRREPCIARYTGEVMQRRRAAQQLRHVLAVLRHERGRGRMTPELADRAEDVVESTAISIEPEPDDSFREMLDYARREIRELREELRKP